MGTGCFVADDTYPGRNYIGESYTEAMSDCLLRYKGSFGILFLLRQITYQLSETRAGRAPGIVDVDKIINSARINFSKNKDIILKQPDGDLIIKEHKILEEYGYKFM